MFDVAYNGRYLSDFGIEKAICENAFTMPEPHVETTHVDGRSGDLHYYYGDLHNVTQTYLCVMKNTDDFRTQFSGFCEWIYQQKGYNKLEDDLFPDKYRMAAVVSQPEIAKTHNTFTISFSCKPQRYLRTGDEKRTFTAEGKIYNPTLFDSLPLVRVYGTGELKIADETITITDNNGYTDIDCDLQDAYHETENRNGNIKLSSGEFFKLHSGYNGIVPASGMTVELTPRWYTL